MSVCLIVPISEHPDYCLARAPAFVEPDPLSDEIMITEEMTRKDFAYRLAVVSQAVREFASEPVRVSALKRYLARMEAAWKATEGKQA